MVNGEAKYSSIIDLTASTYDVDTWYPVLGKTQGEQRLFHYRANNYGNNSVSWSIHNSKNFTAVYDILIKPDNYGWSEHTGIVLNDYCNFCKDSKNPIVFCPLWTQGRPVFYLRGGAQYVLCSDLEGEEWSIITASTSYASGTETLAPTTSPTTYTNYATIGAKINWSNINSKPSTYAPSSHTHTISNVTNLQSTLDAKAASDIVTISSTQPTSDTCKIWVKI